MKRKFLKLMAIPILSMGLVVATPHIIQPLTGSVMEVDAASAKLSAKKKYITKGESFTLTLKNNKKNVRWLRSNKKVKIKKVSNNKVKITGLKKGKSTVTAKIGKKKYQCTVTVEVPQISKTKTTITKGESVALNMSGTKQSVKWSTSNKSVASIKKVTAYSYMVTGANKGTAAISAKVGGKIYKCKITVHTHTWKNHYTTETYSIVKPDDRVYEVPVYEEHYQCSVCNYTSSDQQEVVTHASQTHLDVIQNGDEVNVIPIQVQTGTTLVHRDIAIIEYRDRQVVDYQYCDCGATR